MLEEPWLPVILGMIFVASSQIVVILYEDSPPFNPYIVATIREALIFIGGCFGLVGVYRALRTWNTLRSLASVVLNVQDKEDPSSEEP